MTLTRPTSNILDVTLPDVPIKTYQFVHTSDTVLDMDATVDQANHAVLIGPETIVFPTKGIVSLAFAGQVTSSGGTAGAGFGLRISGTNYWFNSRSKSGTKEITTQTLYLDAASTTYNLHGASHTSHGGMEAPMNIQTAGLPTGSQQVEIIGAGMWNTPLTLKGTTAPGFLFHLTVLDFT